MTVKPEVQDIFFFCSSFSPDRNSPSYRKAYKDRRLTAQNSLRKFLKLTIFTRSLALQNYINNKDC